MALNVGKAEVLLTALLAGAILLYAFVFNSSGALSPENMRSALLTLGIAGPIAYMAFIAIAIVIVPIPSVPFVLVAGFVYGPIVALALTVAGGTAGAMIAFFLARKLGRVRVKKHLAKIDTMKILDRFDSRFGTMAILVTRLVPLFSFDIVSYAAGLTNIRASRFALATAVGMIPVTTGYVVAGNAAFELNIFYLGLAAVALLALFAVAWTFRARIKTLTGFDLNKIVSE